VFLILGKRFRRSLVVYARQDRQEVQDAGRVDVTRPEQPQIVALRCDGRISDSQLWSSAGATRQALLALRLGGIPLESIGSATGAPDGATLP